MTDLCPPPGREARANQRLRTCKLCKFSTTSPRDFLHHQINAHSQDLDVTGCDQCDYVATSEIEIVRHKKMQHISTKRPSVDDSEPGTPNSVDAVDGQFDLNSTDSRSDDSTIVRSGVNLPTRTYTCTECGWSTTSSRQNLYHMVHDHGYDYTIYECDICDYATRYKQKLPRHRKCHFMSPIASPTLTSSSLTSPVPVTIAPFSSMDDLKTENGSPQKDINENVKSSVLLDGNYTESEEKTATSLLALGMALGLTQKDLADDGELVQKAKLGNERADSTSAVNNEDDSHVNTSFNDEESPLVIDTDCVSEHVNVPASSSMSDVEREGGAFVTGSSLPLNLPEPPSLIPKSMNTISLSEFNSSSMTLPTLEKKPDVLPKPKKPGGPIREAVDPAKYIRVQDVDGIKYACSKCGNIYKWRKSLNKHWKEKHDGEIPTPVNPARFTMLNVPRGNGGRSLTSLPIVKTTAPAKPMPKSFSTAKSFLSAASPTMVKDAYRSPLVYEMRPMSNTMVENKPKWTTSSSSSELEALRAKWGIPATLTESKPAVTRPLGSAIASLNAAQTRVSTSISQSLDKKKAFSSSHLPGNSSPFSIPAAHSSSRKEAETCDEAPLDLSMGSSSTPTGKVDTDVLDLSKARGGKPESGLSLTTQADATRYPSIAKQTQSGLVPCYRCTFKARSRREYEDHQEFHRQEWHMCAVCEKQFPSVEELNVHFASHHAEVLHERCLSENEREDFRNRIQTEDDPDSLQLYLYLTQNRDISKCYCVICALFFTWETGLARHFDESHLGLPNPYKKRRAEDDPEIDAKKPRFLDEETLQCGQCSFSARDPAELKKHFLVHTLNRPFACTMCGYSTRWKHDLEQHILRYHTEAKQESAVSQQDAESLMDVEEEDEKSGSDDSAEIDKQQYLSQLGLFSNSSPISYKVSKPSSPSDVVEEVEGVEGLSEAPLTPTRNMSPSPRKLKSGNKTPIANTEVMLPYKCNVCEYRARWPSEIAQHMKNHSDEKPFRCPRCSYKSKWKWDVVKHLKRCGGGTVKDVIDESKDKPQWSRSFNFTVTTTKGHSGGPPNVTVVPDEELSDMADDEKDDAKLVPYSRGHDDGKEAKNSSQLHCLQCNFVATSQWELTRHMRLHSDEKPYCCQTCGYGSKWKCDLKKHLRTYNHSAQNVIVSDDAEDKDGSGSGSGWDNYPHSDSDEEMAFEKPELLRCGQCQYVTYKPNQLESHLKIHQQAADKKSTSIKCKQCDFEASDLPAFLQHTFTHSNNSSDAPKSPSLDNDPEAMEQDSKMTSPRNRRKPPKPFSCSECTFSSFYKSQLDEHMQVHAGNAELSCGLCDYVADSQSDLDEHIGAKHVLDSSGKAPIPAEKARVGKFHCAKCPFITSHRSNYEKHIRSHGLNLRFKCDWCDWSIDRLNLLLRHCRCVHPVEMSAKEARAKVTSSNELQTDMQVMKDLRRDYLAQVKVKKQPLRRRMKTRYACKRCQFATFNGLKIKEHRQLHAVKDKYSRGTKKIRNSWVFVNKRQHIKNGDVGVTLNNRAKESAVNRSANQCPDCPYSTRAGPEFKIHISHHGEEEKFKCDFCSYSVDRINSLTHHRKLHAKQPGYETHLPPETFLNPHYESIINGQVDSGDSDGSKGLVQCEKCPYVCQRLQAMRSHEKLHGANRKHVCGHCDWSTERPNLLVQHERIHGNEPLHKHTNVFKCPSCEFTTSDVHKLSAHQSDHAADGLNNNVRSPSKVSMMKVKPVGKRQRYKCSVCPYHTVTQTLLNNHIKQH